MAGDISHDWPSDYFKKKKKRQDTGDREREGCLNFMYIVPLQLDTPRNYM